MSKSLNSSRKYATPDIVVRLRRLDDEILAFIDQQAALTGDTPNRSGYVNAVLAQHRRAVLEAEMIAALKEDTENADYQAEIAAWDAVAGDGIE